MEVETSNWYPVAVGLAFQFALKKVCPIVEAAAATGSGGAVTSEMVFELEEAPDAFEARMR